MSVDTPRYYQPSGSAPVVGLMITLVIGMVGGSLLAILYSALVFYNPIVYLNILAGMGFAFACGVLSRFGLTIGKVRNRLLAGSAGAAVGFISIFFAWVAFLFFLVVDEQGNGLITFNLNEIAFYIQLIGAQGWWAFNENGNNFSGWGLYLLWAAEALIVIGASAMVAYAKDTPFCEECNQWCDEHECPVTFTMPEDFEALRASLEADEYSPLYQSAQLSPDADVYLKATLYPCPECSETSWLKLEQVVASLNDKGEVETKEFTLINYLDLPREDYDRLMSLVPGSEPMDEQQQVPAEEESSPPAEEPGLVE